MARSDRSAYIGPMDLNAPAIVCAVLPHGEYGAVVRFLTAPHGLMAGYVPGGRSRRLRPVLQPGNGVEVRLRARTETQLAGAAVELTRARTGLAGERMAAATLEWLTSLTATALSEGVAQPRLYAALDGLLDAMMFGAAPRRWLADVIRYELLLLAELGFGLDLATCAATGAAAADADLAYVSPRSSQGVGRVAGAPYAPRLLPLPRLMLDGLPAGPGDLAEGMRTTGYFLERDILTGQAATLLPARERLVAIVTLYEGAPDG
ncbi:MAG: DNA repair protein RecO [Janthinobacterium lividum]